MNGVVRLLDILHFALDLHCSSSASGGEGGSGNGSTGVNNNNSSSSNPQDNNSSSSSHNIVIASYAKSLLIYGMKTLTAVSHFDTGRHCLLSLCPAFTDLTTRILTLTHSCPLAAENALETISRCCALYELQMAFVSAGVIWKLVPMMLMYDGTLSEDYNNGNNNNTASHNDANIDGDESQRAVYNQSACNMHAIVACNVLGRLSGVMFDDLQSPANTYVQSALARLLTAPLAKYLRNRRPWELLSALNANVESVTKIWNVGMRKELLQFIVSIDSTRPIGSREDDLRPIESFEYSCLKSELCIGGVYVRIFNTQAAISGSGGSGANKQQTNDIDDPSQFARELIHYIAGFTLSDYLPSSFAYSSQSPRKQLLNGAGSANTSISNNNISNNHGIGHSPLNIASTSAMIPTPEYQFCAIEGLRTLVSIHDYIATDIAEMTETGAEEAAAAITATGGSIETAVVVVPDQSTASATQAGKRQLGLETVYSLLLYRPDNITCYASIAQLFALLCESPAFIQYSSSSAATTAGVNTNNARNVQPASTSSSSVSSSSSHYIWKLLTALCTINNPHATHIWAAAEHFVAHPEGLTGMMKAHLIPHLLGVLFNIKQQQYVSTYASRLSAISLLSKCLYHPVVGSAASAMLRRFLPEPLVLLLKNGSGSNGSSAAGGAGALKLLDDCCETPGECSVSAVSADRVNE